MNSMENIKLMLRAGYKLILLCTQEESRAQEDLHALCNNTDAKIEHDCYVWTETQGFVHLVTGEKGSLGDPSAKRVSDCKSTAPDECLDWIVKRAGAAPAVYIMKDLHSFIGPRSGRSMVIRKLQRRHTSAQGHKKCDGRPGAVIGTSTGT